MKKYINGQYIDLTPSEIAEMQRQQAIYEAQERKRPLTTDEVYNMFIKQNIQTLKVDDETVLRMVSFYPEWTNNTEHIKDYIYQYDSNLYKCITTHTSQADWTPDKATSLFVRIADPSIEYPDWVQPTGAHDAYALGAKATHNSKKWISEIDNNTYEPGVYGWSKVIE